MQKRVNLNLDNSVYKEFQRLCEEKDILVSRRVERLMKGEIEELKKMLKERDGK